MLSPAIMMMLRVAIITAILLVLTSLFGRGYKHPVSYLVDRNFNELIAVPDDPVEAANFRNLTFGYIRRKENGNDDAR